MTAEPLPGCRVVADRVSKVLDVTTLLPAISLGRRTGVVREAALLVAVALCWLWGRRTLRSAADEHRV